MLVAANVGPLDGQCQKELSCSFPTGSFIHAHGIIKMYLVKLVALGNTYFTCQHL